MDFRQVHYGVSCVLLCVQTANSRTVSVVVRHRCTGISISVAN